MSEKFVVRYVGDAARSHDSAGGAAVLLANLGTPDAPTSAAVRTYLAEFLSDPRVVELPRVLWWPALHGVVLPLRSGRAARAYQSIWTEEGSPLLVHSRRIRDALAVALTTRLSEPVTVALAMRYGRPAIGEELETLRRAGVRRLLVLPLYPQYSSATTGSVLDAVGERLRRWRRVPALQFVDAYHDEDGYIGALARSVREHWSSGARARRLLFSFHGLPKRSVAAGDPYHAQCLTTARLVAQRLELPADAWAVSFQSRFGRAEWLAPYTLDLLVQWARDGIRDVDVICPGFAADCLETLEEIAQQNRAIFRAAGGQELRYIPALNASPEHIAALAGLIRQLSYKDK